MADLDVRLLVGTTTVASICQRQVTDHAGARTSRGRVAVAGERSGGTSGRTLADRLNALVATVHPPDRGPFTDEEIVNGIREAGGPSMSVAYLNHLRRGRRDNPTKTTLEGLARFFRVPVGHLFDDEYGEVTETERQTLTIIRQAGLESLVEQIGALPTETRDSIDRIVADLHRLHGGRRYSG